MATRFDHLVIGAADLSEGIVYVRNTLGIEVPSGGKHPQMGTHNCLVRFGQTSFLEIIAVDPAAAPSPGQPRWFGLDDPHVRASLEKNPRLLTWVVNCDDITAALSGPEIAYGIPQPISRGDLLWYFGVPDDGRLLAGGMLPYVISWQTDSHPASAMADAGCSLGCLRLHTPFAEWSSRQLEGIGAAELVEVIELQEGSAPYLEAEIQTPAGSRILRSTG